jgi:hypothetical protein
LAVLIILCSYAFLVWLLFSKLKLVKWGWGSGTFAVLIGAFILAVFLAMFNYLTPSGSFVVAAISIPADIDRQQLRLGMPGTAWVFADNAGVIGLIMDIVVRISSYTAYL